VGDGDRLHFVTNVVEESFGAITRLCGCNSRRRSLVLSRCFRTASTQKGFPVKMSTVGRVVAALFITVAATMIGAGTASAATAAPQSADGCWVNVLAGCEDD
jgi:hypothetical protein